QGGGTQVGARRRVRDDQAAAIGVAGDHLAEPRAHGMRTRVLGAREVHVVARGERRVLRRELVLVARSGLASPARQLADVAQADDRVAFALQFVGFALAQAEVVPPRALGLAPEVAELVGEQRGGATFRFAAVGAGTQRRGDALDAPLMLDRARRRGTVAERRARHLRAGALQRGTLLLEPGAQLARRGAVVLVVDLDLQPRGRVDDV